MKKSFAVLLALFLVLFACTGHAAKEINPDNNAAFRLDNPLAVAVLAVLLLIGVTALKAASWKRKYNMLREKQEQEEKEGTDRLTAIDKSIEKQIKKQQELMHTTSTRFSDAVKADEKAQAAEKRLSTIQNKYTKYKELLDSVMVSYQAYTNNRLPGMVQYIQEINQLKQAFNLEEPVQLKALTIKELRAKFRQIEKQIQELCESYQASYTTKANSTIYLLVVLALDEGVKNIYRDMSFGKLDVAIAKLRILTEKCFNIAAEGNQTIVTTLSRFIGQIEYLYIEAIKTEYEYYVKLERAKEEQRAIREQMRQEAEERRILEQQRRLIESEERKYKQEIERLNTQITMSAEQQEIEMLRKRLAEIEAQLSGVEQKKEEIINLQNGKAGTVYIISNLGSFGEDVFKIGMTRRLEPMERIKELGDASVPFPFDVHSFIFSEDAVSLENKLHKAFSEKRMNKVNLRKEFFHVTLDEIESKVNEIDPSAPFERTMLAEQFHQSMSIEGAVDETVVSVEDDIE